MHARVLGKTLMHFQECLLFLNIKRTKVMSNCSNSGQIIYCPFIWRFNFIRSYKKIKKITWKIFTIMSKWLCLKLCRTFGQTRLSKHSYKKHSAANGWDFQMPKKSIYPCYEWDSNVEKYLLYQKKSDRSRLLVAKYRVLWTWNYNIQRDAIMVTATYIKSSSLVSFKQNIKLKKDPKCSCRVCKT